MLLIFGSRAGLFLASDDEFDDAWVDNVDVLAELDAIEAQLPPAPRPLALETLLMKLLMLMSYWSARQR